MRDILGRIWQRFLFPVARLVWRYGYWRPLRIWSNHFSRGDLHGWVRRKRAAINGSVLNVGAGGEIGPLVEKCLSIDINPQRKPDIVADACDLREVFETQRFDAVFLIEVLEHVSEPQRALAELRRVLKPGGKLILSVPYIFEMHDVPHDYWRFTEYGLRLLLQDFDDVVIVRRNGYFRAALTPLIRLWYSRYWTDRVLGLLFMFLALLLYPLIALLNGIIRSEYATTGYHVEASKPLLEGQSAT